MLYKTGNIVPTQESINNNIESAEGLIMLAENVLTTKLSLDLYNSVVSAGQALLMEYGYLPPVPKQVAKELDEIAVTKEKVLTKEDAEKVEEIVKWFKKIDHGEVKTITGEDFDKKLKDSKYLVEKITSIIDKIRETKGEAKPIIDKDLLKQTDKEIKDKYLQKEE
jgi:uncharacterized protein (UPF0332 family)